MQRRERSQLTKSSFFPAKFYLVKIGWFLQSLGVAKIFVVARLGRAAKGLIRFRAPSREGCSVTFFRTVRLICQKDELISCFPSLSLSRWRPSRWNVWPLYIVAAFPRPSVGGTWGQGHCFQFAILTAVTAIMVALSGNPPPVLVARWVFCVYIFYCLFFRCCTWKVPLQLMMHSLSPFSHFSIRTKNLGCRHSVPG